MKLMSCAYKSKLIIQRYMMFGNTYRTNNNSFMRCYLIDLNVILVFNNVPSPTTIATK